MGLINREDGDNAHSTDLQIVSSKKLTFARIHLQLATIDVAFHSWYNFIR